MLTSCLVSRDGSRYELWRVGKGEGGGGRMVGDRPEVSPGAFLVEPRAVATQ